MQIIRALLFAGSALLLTACDKQNLLTELDQRQSNEVLATLQQNGIQGTKHENGKLGFSINVAKNDFIAAVDLLKQYNLPSKDAVEIIQAFPGDSLVASPQAERTRLLSLIEQRLEQSITTIPGVVNARVHVSYPLSTNTKVTQPQSISSLVTYAGSEDTKILMSKIKLFLKNSFSDSTYDNVSVVIVERPIIQRMVASSTQSNNSISKIIPLGIAGIGLLVAVIFFFRRSIFVAGTKKNIPTQAPIESDKSK
ncbi:type III secretion inner membrane ring lipoprotein SctJ [Yersinia ruckeri]|uniref:type III secretion system inner membrane ring lipoprotein SctJ n=1 Tax=Yersinia ruckeri TaxID=29486 RepID=UPI0005387C8F|nr:type III secretion inner membrane ring lipoprotein SctJ [Yersinia ruckeri]AUQ40852.1 EscJ/YscJ/HrcJ family type III secretion inner membrane ring protein [Yersinia ruckeri]EKN3346594.1 type III secretion inner membrane ring lipoprotein SctJ [Yersinia ruckeri]EKN4207453.1 type III secretion inner membrane ring lipoprotein SctJ [Yersinia ruckeri]EKN4689440.1 type III secretion inner membrane ring lipoprotein SctJ [Yersinia ruckeri]EKN4706008.1 type III secretion inner membrane ring lipoprotei